MAISKLTATLQSNKPEQTVDHVVLEDEGIRYILTAKVVNQTVFLKPQDWSRFGDEYSLACCRMDLPKGVTTQITFSKTDLSSPSTQQNLLDTPFASRVRTDLFASSSIPDPLTPKIIPIVQKQLSTLTPAPKPVIKTPLKRAQFLIPPSSLPSLPPLPSSSSQPVINTIKIQEKLKKEKEYENEINRYLFEERPRNPNLNFKDLKDLFRDDQKKRFGPLSPKLEEFLETKSSTWSQTLTFPLSQEIKGHLSNVYFDSEKVKKFSKEEREQIATWSQQFTEEDSQAEIIKKDLQAYEAFTPESSSLCTLPSKPLGLINQYGQNNCWLNSILQFITTIPGAYDWFLSSPSLEKSLRFKERQGLVDAVRDAYLEYGSTIGPVATQPIRTAIFKLDNNNIHAQYRQEDAHEGLLLLLGDFPAWDKVKITEEKKVKAIDLWTDGDGNEKEVEAGYIKLKPVEALEEPFKGLSLSIESKSLQEIVSRFFEEKARGDEETFFRETDRGEDHSCRLVSVKRQFGDLAPSSLPMQMKRFNANGSKNLDPIDVPLEISIPHNDAILHYELRAVVMHDGNTLASGHYISYVKRDNQWFLCDDALVKPVDEARVLKEAKQAYLLNYVKLD